MNKSTSTLIARIQNLGTIREQAQKLLQLARQDKLIHFGIRDDLIPDTAEYVLKIMLDNYPDLNIPYHARWRHFEAGGVDRILPLREQLCDRSAEEKGKIFFELGIISVLLDAGAGADWSFTEKDSQRQYSRSEGLALASLAMYCNGSFSRDPQQPLRIDAEPLLHLSEETLAKGFQLSEDNPLAGLSGRVALLNRLGQLLQNKTDVFQPDGRLGAFYTYVQSQAIAQHIPAQTLFSAVLSTFAPIWPERETFEGIPLGDVWQHPALQTAAPGSALIPFHKLSQWLCYSLIEPLEWNQLQLDGIDAFTGLPEYRNGGLFIDMGVLQVKNPELLTVAQNPGSEAIVEWRALTVALLDELADTIRRQLKHTTTDLPLIKILQGGTWEAGRRIAAAKREGGPPPVNIISDGTVF